jgi:hypothetical protein
MGAEAAPEKIQLILEGLLAKTVICTEAERTGDAKGPDTIATFNREDGSLGAVIIGDLCFAAASAAALSMVPPARAEDVVASGSLDENLEADAHEIMEICAQVVSEISSQSCRLSGSSQADEPEGDVAEFVSGSSDSIGISVDIEGYCLGHLAIHLAR